MKYLNFGFNKIYLIFIYIIKINNKFIIKYILANNNKINRKSHFLNYYYIYLNIK